MPADLLTKNLKRGNWNQKFNSLPLSHVTSDRLQRPDEKHHLEISVGGSSEWIKSKVIDGEKPPLQL